MKNNIKQKNGKLPKWAIFAIIGAAVLNIIVFGLIIALAIFDEMNYDIKKNLIIKEELITDLNDKNNSYVITGYVTNESKRTYYDVEIEYYLYDENGNIIGEAKDQVEKIGEGKTWKFSAEYYGLDYKEVTRIELGEIDGN